MNFRHQLKLLLRSRGVSQRVFAERLGKSPAWVSRILKGSLALKSLDEVLRISEVLGCDAAETNLLGRGYDEEALASSSSEAGGSPPPRFRALFFGRELLERAERAHGETLPSEVALVAPGLDPQPWGAEGGEVLEGPSVVVARLRLGDPGTPGGASGIPGGASGAAGSGSGSAGSGSGAAGGGSGAAGGGSGAAGGGSGAAAGLPGSEGHSHGSRGS